MTRVQLLLAGLGAVLIVVLFWLLLWSPANEELQDVRAETEDLEAQQQQTAGRIAVLEAVREEAPQQEALLAASHALLPQDPGLPAFLRQIQLAADESGLLLEAVSPARPSPLVEVGEDLHNINVAMDLEGSYFQLVDFLRRIEDPEITPRALLVNSVVVAGDPEDHPILQFSIQGDLFTVLPTTPAEGPPVDDDDDDDDDADVEIDIEENEQ